MTYLGCVLDDKLTGEGMATRAIKGVNQRNRLLGRIPSFVNKTAVKTLAGALIHLFPKEPTGGDFRIPSTVADFALMLPPFCSLVVFS